MVPLEIFTDRPIDLEGAKKRGMIVELTWRPISRIGLQAVTESVHIEGVRKEGYNRYNLSFYSSTLQAMVHAPCCVLDEDGVLYSSRAHIVR